MNELRVFFLSCHDLLLGHLHPPSPPFHGWRERLWRFPSCSLPPHRVQYSRFRQQAGHCHCQCLSLSPRPTSRTWPAASASASSTPTATGSPGLSLSPTKLLEMTKSFSPSYADQCWQLTDCSFLEICPVPYFLHRRWSPLLKAIRRIQLGWDVKMVSLIMIPIQDCVSGPRSPPIFEECPWPPKPETSTSSTSTTTPTTTSGDCNVFHRSSKRHIPTDLRTHDAHPCLFVVVDLISKVLSLSSELHSTQSKQLQP